jgi:transposase InsO family protein
LGRLCIAFVIDIFAPRIVGRRASRTAHGLLARRARARLARTPPGSRKRARASQRSWRAICLAQILGTQRDAGFEPSAGAVGDSYDNALAETINGLYKAEVIWRRGACRNFEAVEFAALEWADWFNNKILLEPIGNIPLAEAEAGYHAQFDERHGGVTQPKWAPANPAARTASRDHLSLRDQHISLSHLRDVSSGS